jgi:hypothetical protein
MDLFRESLRLELIGELPKLVEIDTRPEPEGVGNRLRRGMNSGRRGLADAGTNCSIHRLLKGNAEFARTLFQQSCEIIIERQSRPHFGIMDAVKFDVKTSASRFRRFEISIRKADASRAAPHS